MVEGGILDAHAPTRSIGRKVVYSLTAKGEALLPVVLALRQWGEDWGHGTQEIVLADQRDGKPVRPIRVLAEDGRELELHDLMWIDRDRRERDASSKAARGTARIEKWRPSSAALGSACATKLTRSRRPTGSGAAGRRR